MEAGARLLLGSSDFPHILLHASPCQIHRWVSPRSVPRHFTQASAFPFWPHTRGAKLKQPCCLQHLPLKKPSNQPHTHHPEPSFELASSCWGCSLPDPGPESMWLSLGLCFPLPLHHPFVPVSLQNSWEGPHLLGCREPTQGDIRGKNFPHHPWTQ